MHCGCSFIYTDDACGSDPANSLLVTQCCIHSPSIINISTRHCTQVLQCNNTFVQGPYDWHPAPQKLKDACRKAAKCCSDQGVSLRKLALQAAVKNSDMATQLVGMGSIQEVCPLAFHMQPALQCVAVLLPSVLKCCSGCFSVGVSNDAA